MRIVFAGTPPFAARSLAALLEAAPAAGWSVVRVLTQPDRPAGRGLRLAPSPVKQLSLEHGIPVDTPVSLRKGDDAEAARARLQQDAADVLVVAAYGLILPQAVLDLPRGLRPDWPGRLAAVNVHASLLPRWRGAAPVARAIEAGDAQTGITIMQMDAGLDTGPMLLSEAMAIGADETAGTLTMKLADLGAHLLVRALQSAASLVARPQPSEGVTYAAKIDKAEAWLDWSSAAAVLARRVRAFDPFPVALARLGDEPIRVWKAAELPAESGANPRADPGAEPAGTVLSADADGIVVRCGAGCLRLTELQRPGGRRLAAREFLAGHPLTLPLRLTNGPAHA